MRAAALTLISASFVALGVGLGLNTAGRYGPAIVAFAVTFATATAAVVLARRTRR